MLGNKKVLCSNQGAGNYDVAWPGGKTILLATATWGGGSIKLQLPSEDGSTYVDIPSSTLSANGMLTVELPQCTIRAVVATSTAVYAVLHKVPY